MGGNGRTALRQILFSLLLPVHIYSPLFPGQAPNFENINYALYSIINVFLLRTSR